MDLTGAIWRKSSRSSSNGGQCIEVAAWRKSSHSGPNGGDCVEVGVWQTSSHSSSNGGNCVEVAPLAGVVAVRDSKDPDGPALAFSHEAWRAFTSRLKDAG
ncbi:DUF397 domain-containing protein [Spirillospora sp. NPDC048911]|uniref:DUF397 domain-containing protein n=1 Tax=Spirillospora sp. NPDC048911 TaxID=3364527 RepID=UPI00371966C2